MKKRTSHLILSQPAKYQIKIQGKHNGTWSDWMDGLEIVTEHNNDGITLTILSGVVKDQAGLHGMLNRIRDLNIPLISVQYLHPIYFEKE
jgi:sporulation-control protein spo0M